MVVYCDHSHSGHPVRRAEISYYACGHEEILLCRTDVQAIPDGCFGRKLQEVKLPYEAFPVSYGLDAVRSLAREWLAGGRKHIPEAQPTEHSLSHCKSCKEALKQK